MVQVFDGNNHEWAENESNLLCETFMGNTPTAFPIVSCELYIRADSRPNSYTFMKINRHAEEANSNVVDNKECISSSS